jgi:hypothetical protein
VRRTILAEVDGWVVSKVSSSGYNTNGPIRAQGLVDTYFPHDRLHLTRDGPRHQILAPACALIPHPRDRNSVRKRLAWGERELRRVDKGRWVMGHESERDGPEEALADVDG